MEKNKQNFLFRIKLWQIGIIILVAIPAFLLFQLFPKKTQNKNSYPVRTGQVEQEKLNSGWQEYFEGEIYTLGIGFYTPKGWRVQTKKDEPFPNGPGQRYLVDFAPLGWERPQGYPEDEWYGWGTLFVDIYPLEKDIDTWTSTYFPDSTYITHETAQVANKEGYFVYSKDKTKEFRGRYVVLGRLNTYVFTFGEGYHIDEKMPIAEQIFPLLTFY